MEEGGLALASAVGFGFLTSISPCPLATNVAAVSFIGRQIGRPWQAFLAGILYTLGRMLAYTVVGALVLKSLVSVIDLASFLQSGFNWIVGPVLVLVGILLLGLFKFEIGGGGLIEKVGRRIPVTGPAGAGLLGIVFALSFCPISAGLFFGSLIGLARAHDSVLIIPAAFGLGTGLPAWLFAGLIAFGTRWVGRVYDKLATFEKWARIVAGIVFVIAGLYQMAQNFIYRP